MFSQACDKNSVHRAEVHAWDTHTPGNTCPPSPPDAVNERNAFLFEDKFVKIICVQIVMNGCGNEDTPYPAFCSISL